MLRIVVEGAGSAGVEASLREALADVEGDWVVVAVGLIAGWMVSFPVSPGDAMLDTAWTGPRHRIRDGVRSVLRHMRPGASAAPLADTSA